MAQTQIATATALFEGLREVLAEVKYLYNLMAHMAAVLPGQGPASATSSATINAQFLQKEIATNLNTNGSTIDTTLTTLLNMLKVHPSGKTDSVDTQGYITTMQIEWRSATSDWSSFASGQLTASERQIVLKSILSTLDDMISRGELLTIPDLVNEKLHDMHTGQCLNFFVEYADECDATRLHQLWGYLKDHPLRINGVLVDPGQIYRADARTSRRVLSLVIITLVALGGALLIYLMQLAELFSDDPTLSLLILLRAYGVILAGGLTHSFIDIYKQYRVNANNDMGQLNNWFLWVHINEVKICWTVLTLWVGFLIYAFAGFAADWRSAFFVGYSVDSFLEAFMLRFTGLSAQRLSTLSNPQSETAPEAPLTEGA